MVCPRSVPSGVCRSGLASVQPQAWERRAPSGLVCSGMGFGDGGHPGLQTPQDLCWDAGGRGGGGEWRAAAEADIAGQHVGSVPLRSCLLWARQPCHGPGVGVLWHKRRLWHRCEGVQPRCGAQRLSTGKKGPGSGRCRRCCSQLQVAGVGGKSRILPGAKQHPHPGAPVPLGSGPIPHTEQSPRLTQPLWSPRPALLRRRPSVPLPPAHVL